MYLTALSSRKDYVICGREFGLENVGKVALIHRALYGGKTAGQDYRNHLRTCMQHLDYVSCPADPDLWMRPAVKADGSTYYSYILLYVDNVLVIDEDPENILRRQLGKYFTLKEDSIGEPKIYLGGHVRKVVLENGVEAWSFSPNQYVKSAVSNVKEYVGKHKHLKIPPHCNTPIQTSYRPKLDITPELSSHKASYYMSLIGMLQWIVELGRVDICLKVLMMSSHVTLPREGHLQQVFHIFSYLDKFHNTELVFDPSDPLIDKAQFERKDWTCSEYGHVEGEEILPDNMPVPCGLGLL